MTIIDTLRMRRLEVLDIAARHGAKNIRIFGSAVRGEDRPDSDLDLLVEMEEGRSLLDRIAAMQDLEDLLGCKVDVVNERALHWYIKDSILSQAVPL